MDPVTQPPQIQTPPQAPPPVRPQTNPSSSSKFPLIILGVLVLIISLLGGYLAYTRFINPSSTETSSSSKYNQDQGPNDLGASPAPTLSGPKTYISEKYGWSIVYPEGIYVTQVHSNPTERGDNFLDIVDFSSKSPGETALENQSESLNFSVHTLQTSGQNLEDLARSISSKENANYQLGGTTLTPITINGIQGYKEVIEGNTEISGWTDVYLPGKDAQSAIRIRYYYSGDNYKTIADSMVSSFKTN